MSTKIIFDVPKDVTRLAEVVYDNGGAIEGEDCESPEQVLETLTALAGRRGMTVEFASHDEVLARPIDQVKGIVEILEAAGNARYAYSTEAFVEPSRGVRVLGRVGFNLGSGPREYQVPWQHGESEFDVTTLESCGVSRIEAAAIITEFHEDPPAPAGP